MNYLLVLQFSEDFVGGIDRIVELEDHVIEVLDDTADVDGHDFGAGEANIFIFTDTPAETFERSQTAFDTTSLANMKAAYRHVEKEIFTVLHPPGLTEFKVA